MAITMKTIVCPVCKKEAQKSAGHFNRANKLGVKMFCSRTCFHEHQRHHKTVDQKKAEKSIYDKLRREKLGDSLLKVKREKYHASLKDNLEVVRRKQKEQRDKNKASGYRERYLKSEKYKNYKHNYDQKHRAEKKYGEFSEAYLVQKELDKILESKRIKYESGLINKSQKRKRNGN